MYFNWRITSRVFVIVKIGKVAYTNEQIKPLIGKLLIKNSFVHLQFYSLYNMRTVGKK